MRVSVAQRAAVPISYAVKLDGPISGEKLEISQRQNIVGLDAVEERRRAIKRLARDNNFRRWNAEGNESFHNLVELCRSPPGIASGPPALHL